MRKLIKTVARRVGIDIKRYIPSSSHELQIAAAIKRLQINILLDVGANEGQFAQQIRDHGYQGRIISFEPLTEAHQRLTTKAASDRLWHVCDRCAVGSSDSNVSINVSGNSVSSSLLPMLALHSAAASNSSYTSSESVPMNTLDTLCRGIVPQDSRAFLKIDTQGYEMQVLQGARSTLPMVSGILCELSLAPLYQGQSNWRDVVDYLDVEGFAIWGVLPGFTDSRTGQTLQFDGLFLRRDYF